MIGFVVVTHACKKCSRKDFSLLNQMIVSLNESCKKEYKLYIFDNGSDFECDYPDFGNTQYVKIKEQDGLAIPLNEGVKMAVNDDCDIIVIANDDLIFNEDVNVFLEIIKNHEHNDVGVYGCLTNGVLKVNYLQKAEKKGKGMVEITDKMELNGFLFAFTRTFYEKFKMEDGNMFSLEHKWKGGEVAFRNRILPLGGRLFVIKDFWIYHHKIRGWKNHL